MLHLSSIYTTLRCSSLQYYFIAPKSKLHCDLKDDDIRAAFSAFFRIFSIQLIVLEIYVQYTINTFIFAVQMYCIMYLTIFTIVAGYRLLQAYLIFQINRIYLYHPQISYFLINVTMRIAIAAVLYIYSILYTVCIMFVIVRCQSWQDIHVYCRYSRALLYFIKVA